MAITKYILDTGPLVAFFNQDDHYHSWAVEVMGKLTSPPLITEAVVTEACWQLRSSPQAVARVLEMPSRGEVQVRTLLSEEGVNLAGKIRKYGTRMDFADACVLRLAELTAGAIVITLDTKDFTIYRMHRDDLVPILAPSR